VTDQGMCPTPAQRLDGAGVEARLPIQGLPAPWTLGNSRAISPASRGLKRSQCPCSTAKDFTLPEHPIGPLRRFWAVGEERIILASALMHHLRKRINAQRLGLSTCKTGALPLSYGPKHCYI